MFGARPATEHTGRVARPLPRRTAGLLLAGGLLASCVRGGRPGGSATTTSPQAGPTTITPVPAARPGTLPAGFSPASATFVSPTTGWVLGTGPCGSGSCPQLLKTTDGGRAWTAVPAPPAPVDADGAAGGVAEIRFANSSDGWAFRPTLWSTHDGGAHWARQPLEGVEALEAADGAVHAVTIGDGGFRFTVQTSRVHTDTWGPAGIDVASGAGPSPHAQLVVAGKAGWIVFTNRVDFAGAKLRAGRWTGWNPPCGNGGSGALAAPTATHVEAFCSEGVYDSRPSALRAYVSADGGASFTPLAQTMPLRWVDTVAAAGPGVWVVGGNDTDDTAVLARTADGGGTWQTVQREPGGHWQAMSFTGAEQGIVLHQVTGAPATLLMTHDAGQTWAPVGTR